MIHIVCILSSIETNHFLGKIKVLSFLKRVHPPVKHLLISLRSTVSLHSTHQKSLNINSINFVIESLMGTYYTISSFIWTDQLEWPNYIKTYMHFFAECLQACTVYMYNSPHTRLYCCTRIWGKPNHLGHQICRWVQTDHTCTKTSVWTFFMCKRIQIWSCYDLWLYLSTTQHLECISVD